MLFLMNNAVAGTRRLTLPSLRVRVLQGLGVCRRWATVAALPVSAAFWLCTAQAQVPAGPSPAPFAGAVVSEWKGEVHVQLPGTNMSRPIRGQVLIAGSVLETGDGRLVLVLRTDESEILVQPHARLVVREPAPGNWNAVEILLGRVHAYIRKRTGGAPPFQMGTPSAVIAVRGTRFDVEVNGRGVSEVDVFDGLVEVASSTIPGSSVLVSPGFSTRVGMWNCSRSLRFQLEKFVRAWKRQRKWPSWNLPESGPRSQIGCWKTNSANGRTRSWMTRWTKAASQRRGNTRSRPASNGLCPLYAPHNAIECSCPSVNPPRLCAELCSYHRRLEQGRQRERGSRRTQVPLCCSPGTC